jgi:hypothetical protein
MTKLNIKLKLAKFFDVLLLSLLSEVTRQKIEVATVFIAIASFALHLAFIGLFELNLIAFSESLKFLANPIAAIYTPFSFILIYEVYLLVFYLPRSITVYIGKQYEIITLIIVRKIFHDLSMLKFTPDWFNVAEDLQFTFDLIATLGLFSLILVFYRLNPKKIPSPGVKKQLSFQVTRFVNMKRIVAACLVPILTGLAFYSLYQWVWVNFYHSTAQPSDLVTNINQIFFDKCFTVLILVDVFLLLISFLTTDKFNKVIRNSGFIISTILIKLSFSAEGIMTTILVFVAVLFGVLILALHNQYDKIPID